MGATDEAVLDDVVVSTRKAPKTKEQAKPKRQPRYHVVLWDDEEHTYEYVILMLHQLFGYSFEKAYAMAKEVDTTGRVIVLTTTKEHAELKRDQIHAFGKDPFAKKCSGSMSASIEPEC
ncbi:MAG: ATP-dependent Clp protease ClpS [Pirellulaceae bacterium]|nr:MAG: ATP-dependent Clp protease ClpS [Pirellulaceae bacterium]